MGLQFERVVFSPTSSLTLIVDDLLRQSRYGSGPLADTQPDIEDWINALQRQSTPLIHTTAGRANLEAWLAEVEQLGAP
ncbi:MAG: hypothetical protein JNK21_04830 [Rhodospirillaceae bacterium]|nr:hypothetical protein [Rhodospirillaceae bacterium]